MVQGLGPDNWCVFRFDTKLQPVRVSDHASEGGADAEGLRLAQTEHVNAFKPSGDGIHLALFFDGRGVRTEWLQSPGSVSVKIEHK